MIALISATADTEFAAAQSDPMSTVDQAFANFDDGIDEFDIVDKIDVQKAEAVISRNIALAQHTKLINQAIRSTDAALKVYEQLDNLARSEARISSILQEIIGEAKLAKTRLNESGVSRDMIAGFLIQLLSDKIITSDLDDQEILDIVVQINENFAKLTDPRHTLDALYNRARTEKKLGKDIRLFEAVLRISNELIRIEAAKLLVDPELRGFVDTIIENSVAILKGADPEKALILAERMVEIHSRPEEAHAFLVPFGHSFRDAEFVEPDHFSDLASLDQSVMLERFTRMIGAEQSASVNLITNLIANFDEKNPAANKISLALTEALAAHNQLDMALLTSFWAARTQADNKKARDSILQRVSGIMSRQERGFPALEAAGKIRDAKMRNQALNVASRELAVSGYKLAVETTANKILGSVEFDALDDTDIDLLVDLGATLGSVGSVESLETIKSLTTNATVLAAVHKELTGVAIRSRDPVALETLLSQASLLDEIERTWVNIHLAALSNDMAGVAEGLEAVVPTGGSDQSPGDPVAGRLSLLGSYIHSSPAMAELVAATASSLPVSARIRLVHGHVTTRFGDDPGSLTEMAFASSFLDDLVASGSLPPESLVSALETYSTLGDVAKTDLLLNMTDGSLPKDEVLHLEAVAFAASGDFARAQEMVSEIGSAVLAENALVETLKIKARLGNFEEASRQLKSIGDFRLRTDAYRSIAEWAARDLDSDGRLSGTHPSAYAITENPDLVAAVSTGAGKAKAVSFNLADENTLRVSDNARLMSQAHFVEGQDFEARIPGLDASAAEVRGLVPLLPRAGPSGLSVAGLNRFARLNRFSSKFFEEVVGMSARDYLYKRQGTINPIFLYLTEGVFTVEKLLYLSVSGRFRTVDRLEDGYIFRAPIVIGPNATLVLSGQEANAFYLSQSYGSFIVNAGKLFVVDTTLGAFDETRQDFSFSHYKNRKNFRPFILSWSNSETYIGGSRVVGLGYSAGKSYGLSLSSGPKDSIDEKRQDRRPFGIIADNSFDNMLYGFYSFEADDVAVVGNEYRNNITYGLDPHDRSRRLTLAYNTGYGTLKKHGGIISREVDDSFLVGNLMFDNAGSGLMVDRDSMATTVYANTAFGNEQDGLTYFESPCAVIDSNHFFNNKRAGIKARNSWDLSITRNLITGNAEAAIDGYISRLEESGAAATRDFNLDPYLPFATLYAAGNTFENNNIGVKTNGLSAVTLRDNTFIFQKDGLFGGDLKEHALWLLKYGSDNQPVTVKSSCLPQVHHHKACALFKQGVIASHAAAPQFANSDVTDHCLGDKTSLQALAVEPATN